ncbi:MAG: hypothetical protein A2W07_03310 [candidate division Zixibacteria bacterium RBG_16_43_9]|nr:MAG: hypothetical protein A2W07_03310 [candidate division Zixibacteria bacterium RBG_16_43_9]
MMETIGIWIAALLTLGIFSFLYKDNPFYKFCESLFVGISAGYWFVTTFWQVFMPKLADNLIAGRFYYMIGAIFGVLMLLRLFPKIGWLSRWSLALVVGTTAGLYFTRYLVSNGMVQVQNTIIPLYVKGNLSQTIGNLVIVIGTFSGLIYFFFSKEHKGAFGGLAKLGIWFLMLSFGASFGYTVMSRMSLLIGRMDYLLGTWLGLIR